MKNKSIKLWEVIFRNILWIMKSLNKKHEMIYCVITMINLYQTEQVIKKWCRQSTTKVRVRILLSKSTDQLMCLMGNLDLNLLLFTNPLLSLCTLQSASLWLISNYHQVMQTNFTIHFTKTSRGSLMVRSKQWRVRIKFMQDTWTRFQPLSSNDEIRNSKKMQ